MQQKMWRKMLIHCVETCLCSGPKFILPSSELLARDKSTTPPISHINQDANTETPSPPPTSSGAVQNKGSSTMVPQSKACDIQVEHETSSPSEDDLPVSGKQILEENEDSQSIPRDSSLKRAQFPADYAEDEKQYSDGFETYFREDEDMEEVEPQLEDAHPTHPDTTDEPGT
ncbi:hypothetical protein RYX36_025747 [Vicia faba]